MELSDTFRIIHSILHDIAASPNGMSTGEIVQKYKLSRRVVPKYISILEASGVPIYVVHKRYYIDSGYRVAFTLTPVESELLSLSLQRSLALHGTNRDAIRSLIAKLRTKMADNVADELTGQTELEREEIAQNRWFSLLTEAKHKRMEVWVDYHPPNRPEPSRWRIRPHRFIANPFSDGLYVLCDGSRDGTTYIPLSLKFDRILDVQPTGVRFGILERAQFATTDRAAWGVWSAAQQPVTVMLRFEARYYDRLLESSWHPTQRISIDHTGAVTFTVQVSEPQEMIPWIRSWGSGVVVLEPESLRQRIIQSIHRQIQAYGLSPEIPDVTTALPLDLLWAKYDPQTGQYHTLLYHLLDVAAVAWVMWEQVLSVSQHRWLCDVLRSDEDTTRRLLAFLAGLHDIGKATSAFQRKAPVVYNQLLAVGMLDERPVEVPHGVHSAVILRRLLEAIGIDTFTARIIAAVIGGHHGAWISFTELGKQGHSAGGEMWQQLQASLFDHLRRVFDMEALPLPDDEQQLNLFAAFLSGFVSVCDWVGSHEEYFTYHTAQDKPEEYFERSVTQAQFALEELGWFGWRPPQTRSSFAEMFAFQPNDFQRTASAIFDAIAAQPRLILVEYLTGGGKTELALYLADVLMNTYGLSGTYIAMPTQATSNQMFERVSRYLNARYPAESINLQLAHAQAEFHPLYQQFQSHGQREGNESGIVAERWFQNRKRTLLAPFAVGTVDQAMMSVLQAKHHFVRQYALSHKVVVFDEIHSYDTYMNEIIARLMSWLTGLGSPLLLLSATLPVSSRARLVSQVGGHGHISSVPYPRMTVVTAQGQVEVHALPRPPSRTLNLQYIDGDLQRLGDELATLYSAGGCIAVICNTVGESIEVARYLHHHPAILPDDVMLFHARFPSAWRGDIERQVLDRFGKEGQRPERAILVATQIIEQSLDLDFDVMVTRTAPIDLLIQRAGRLHRHARSRPPHLITPTLIIRAPEFKDDVPQFGVDEAIYQRFILLRTWLVLRGRPTLNLPDDLDTVMNFVYDDLEVTDVSEAYSRALETAYDEMALKDTRSSFRGTQHLIALPDNEQLVGAFSERLPDDEDHNISTRDIEPSIDIICLGTMDNAALPALPQRRLTQEDVKQLLCYKIAVRDKKLVRAIKAALEPDERWERIAGLRFARAVLFQDGEYTIPGTQMRLTLSSLYGLEYDTKESA